MIDIVGVGGKMFYSVFPRDYNQPITGTMYTQLTLDWGCSKYASRIEARFPG